MILESCPEVALLLERVMDGWPAISDRSRARNGHDLKRKKSDWMSDLGTACSVAVIDGGILSAWTPKPATELQASTRAMLRLLELVSQLPHNQSLLHGCGQSQLWLYGQSIWALWGPQTSEAQQRTHAQLGLDTSVEAI